MWRRQIRSILKYISTIALASGRRFLHLPQRTLRIAALLLFLSGSCALAASLKAAVEKVELTPAAAFPLWGYSDRKSSATGIRDPLYARVLVLEVFNKRLALVTLDLGRTFGPKSLEQLRTATHKDVSILLVAATHTHSAPAVQDDYLNGPPEWESAALRKIANAVEHACQNLQDAQLGTGYGNAFLGHNRLRVNTEGTVSWFERNLTRLPTWPVDGTVSILRIDDLEGQPIAILVNYACHPVVFGSDNVQYSADFPAAMTRIVEDAFARKTVSFFLQGAPGDINPYFAVTPLEQDAIAAREWTGRILGEEAVRIARGIHTQAEASDLQFAQDVVHVRMRWDPNKMREARIAVFGTTSSPFTATPTEMDLPVTTVLINKKIAILTMPGEPFVEYQINWRQRCPVPDAFFIGYANGYNGYFPTIRSATLGGYGAGNPATWVEVGAGDRMIDMGVIRINEMLGHLKDLPEDFSK